VGTGGKSYYPFETIQANSEVRIANTDGVLKLTLGTSGYQWEFVPVAGQVPTDSGSAPCHASVAEAPDDTNIASGPSGVVNDDSAMFGFSYSQTGASFECGLDGDDFGACQPPREYSALTDGQHTFKVRATDALGNVDPTPASRTWAVDTQPPVADSLSQSLVSGSTLGMSTVPVKMSWPATDTTSGVIKYQPQRSTDGGSYADEPLSNATATKTVSLSPGVGYRFRARAMDRAANWSEWGYGPQFVVDTHQETSGAITYGGLWTQQDIGSAYGGGTKHAQTSGAKATFTFTGRNVAWVATKGPNRGRAEVWVDGVKVKTVDLYAATTQARKVVFAKGWPASGNHVLEVKVLGTKNASSSGKLVDVDAFVALR
jgi:hypothetical protein